MLDGVAGGAPAGGGFLLLVVGDAATQNQVRGRRQLQAGHTVEGVLGGLAGGAHKRVTPGRGGGVIAGPVVEIAKAFLNAGRGAATHGTEIQLAVAGAQYQFVMHAVHLEGAAGLQVDLVLLAVDVVPRRTRCGDAQAGGPVGVAGGPEQACVGLVLDAVVIQPDVPGVHALLEGGKPGLARAAPVRPFGGRGLAAWPVGAGAVVIPGGQATPHAGPWLVALAANAHAQLRVGREIGIDDAIEGVLALFVQVDVAVASVDIGDEAAADTAIGVQRAADVGIEPAFLPAAQPETNLARELAAVGVLSDLVDGGRWIARAGEQAGGAAHHLDAVVQDGVITAFPGTPGAADRHRHTIGAQVVDIEAPGAERVATAVVGAARNARGVLQGLGEAAGTLVRHLLVGDDADRLRCFARRQRQAGGGVGGQHAGTGPARGRMSMTRARFARGCQETAPGA